MADTRAYHEVEAYIRDEVLPAQFIDHHFHKERVTIGMKHDGTLAMHEFDAVSEDGLIVISVKAGAGRTSGGRAPTGQIKDCYTEVLFLSMTKAEERFLAITDRELHDVFSKVSDGKLPGCVKLIWFPLPKQIEDKLRAARSKASKEVSPKRW